MSYSGTLLNNFCSSKTIFPSFYTSQASTDHLLCFKSFKMTSYQSVVNINIIIHFLIGHKAVVSLCTTLPYTKRLPTCSNNGCRRYSVHVEKWHLLLDFSYIWANFGRLLWLCVNIRICIMSEPNLREFENFLESFHNNFWTVLGFFWVPWHITRTMR